MNVFPFADHRRALTAAASDAPAVVRDDAGAVRAPSSRFADQLRSVCDDRVVLLHHRASGDAEGPRVFDHLAVAPSGVWVVHSRGNEGRVAMRSPMFGRAKLTIGGRERSDLLAGLERQFMVVAGALAGAGVGAGVTVRTALSFVDTPAPLERSLYLGSYLFFGSQALARHLNSDGPHDAQVVAAVADRLEAAFPPA